MKFIVRLVVILFVLASMPAMAVAGDVVWFDGDNPVTVGMATEADAVVATAVDMFRSDIEAVTGLPAVETVPSKSVIAVYQLDKADGVTRNRLQRSGIPVDSLCALIDGFAVATDGDRILVAGGNGRGTAYGLLHLSRLAGVSPWIWWGDVVPEHRDRLTLPEGYSEIQGASVEFRGIFVNDEDWSLRPWSASTFEPENDGGIGPRTYREIFRLLMRLRANAVWPAMHPGTAAFFKNPANKLVADSCGIAVGSSHCEPLLRNNVDEWDVAERGSFNYITNRDEVLRYWTERLRQVKDSSGGNLLTIGMRGIHDGSMEGVRTMEEKLSALQNVIDDQQRLIAENLGDPSCQPQVFIPYKEVLQLYEIGVKVPDWVTLMWCDDNYGYVTRLSNPVEQLRTGGAGVYYHLSYWGRPHDYLWLSTTQPGLISGELRNLYNNNVRKLWIANVHDPKVAAYNLQLFLDMAWDINAVYPSATGRHLLGWLTENFGREAAVRLYPVMRRYYSLTAWRRPEFMGWNQVELSKKKYERGLGPVTDTEFSFTEFGSEADRYMSQFCALRDSAMAIAGIIPDRLADAYFAAVVYPVGCAAENSVKMLEAQRARLTGDSIAAARSMVAYKNIVSLTDFYNNRMSRGKWRNSMDMSPRNLPDADAPVLPFSLSDREIDSLLRDLRRPSEFPLDTCGVIARNADAFLDCIGECSTIDMLGHSGNALELSKGSSVVYGFELADTLSSAVLTTAVIPTQPADSGSLRYSVSIDSGEPVVYELKEPFRSERWKLNVMRGQAVRKSSLPALAPGHHTLTIKALDNHIILDQWCVDPNPSRNHYLLPIDF